MTNKPPVDYVKLTEALNVSSTNLALELITQNLLLEVRECYSPEVFDLVYNYSEHVVTDTDAYQNFLGLVDGEYALKGKEFLHILNDLNCLEWR